MLICLHLNVHNCISIGMLGCSLKNFFVEAVSSVKLVHSRIQRLVTISDKRAHSGNFSKPNRNFLTKILIVKCSLNATYKQGIPNKKPLTVAVADIIIDLIRINSIIRQSAVPIEILFQ